ncbi:hypothetical protein, partial [uncultured Agrobacterium sp.]|uniref:hypothetical protein n=1 Tax=uncultured Agrobacterium sp. TaxID=157277 RepID=UPI002586FFEC
GLSAAGRSSLDPATACKVEAKKRECTARRSIRRNLRAHAGKGFGATGHAKAYKRRNILLQVIPSIVPKFLSVGIFQRRHQNAPKLAQNIRPLSPSYQLWSFTVFLAIFARLFRQITFPF